ncbi:amino acid adenylation domain-containing protein [Tumebacillus lipolyticus]|uniref:Amino acid adenylation domain-containing protein n=1 Tax=Tumebacillus lipolyticus TaxID=1280370 RepID=A0ABW4ZS94_9BACL
MIHMPAVRERTEPALHAVKTEVISLPVQLPEAVDLQVGASALAALLYRYTGEELIYIQMVDALLMWQPAAEMPFAQFVQTAEQVKHGDQESLDVLYSSLEAEADFSAQAQAVLERSSAEIALFVSHRGEGLFICRTDRLSKALLSQLGDHYVRLLDAVIADPGKRLKDLPLLSEAERTRQLVEWNDASLALPPLCSLHELFARQAAETPDRVAVVCGADFLTFADLNRRANRLAHHLQRLGIGPERTVGLCLSVGIELMIALLAVWKAGGAYVPIDPAYPKERKLYVIEDAELSVLLTESRLVGALPAHQAIQLTLDQIEPDLASEADTDPSCAGHPQQLAYIIYTSGSTGKPKGVLIEHASLFNHLHALRHAIYQQQERPLQVALNSSLAFDASLAQIELMLQGHTLHLLVEEVRLDPQKLVEYVRERKIDVLDGTPSQVRLLLRAGLLARGQHLPSVMLIGGEAIDQQLWRELAAASETACYNVYGPTENTIDALYCQIKADQQGPALGRPIPNVEVYIVDEHLQPVPVGVPGELLIGGRGLARGYLHRPALTAEKFIPHPFATENGTRLYRTGDLACYRADGTVEFLGRLDDQVKLNGFRIELSEIAKVIAEHPSVADAVVLVREDEPAFSRLVAYVISSTISLSSRELQAFVRQYLPSYMVPVSFVFLDSFPLTVNGKLDQRALPTPDLIDCEEAAEYEAPRDRTERKVAELFARLLGRTRVGVRADFFDLGGNSLLAAQAVSRLHDTFGVELSVRTLFESPTVAELSEQVESAIAAGASFHLPPITNRSREAPLPLSHAQQRMWFLDQFEQNSALYNIPTGIRLSGSLNLEALSKSFYAVVERHEALRTTFSLQGEQPVQVIAAAPADNMFTVIDLSDYPGDPDAEVHQLTTEVAERPFDLQKGPLLHAALFRLSAVEHVLIINLHHSVADGWSLGVFTEELAMLYRHYAAGAAVQLPELPFQYADYAAWQQEWLQGEVLQSQISFWREQLDGAPPILQLPTDRPRPATRSVRGSTELFLVPRQVLDKLNELCRREGASLYMCLLAGFKTLLYRYSGQADLSVGSPVAGRHRGETENLIGFFVNTLVMRTQLSGEMSFVDLLQQVRDVSLRAFANQDLPFDRLVEELVLERDLSSSPLFQVLFVLQNAFYETVQFPDIQSEEFFVDTSTAKFDLTLQMHEAEQGLVASLEYSTDLFDRATILRMIVHLQNLFQSIVERPEMEIGKLSMLTEAETRQLLFDWNDTRADYPEDKCMHQLFEFFAAQTPDEIALVYRDERMTYRELNERANRLAHYLQNVGVGPEVIVGICLERSLDMVIGLLGILKAGGAFVALDPAYPKDRLAFVMEDTSIPFVLTQSSVQDVLPAHSGRLILLDRDREAIDSQSPEDLQSGVGPDNLIYLIYTSGSTGRPKAIAMRHQPLTNMTWWQVNSFAHRGKARVLQFASLNFDVSYQELFTTFYQGGTVIIPDEETRRDSHKLLELIVEQRIERIFLPFILLTQLAEVGESGGPLPHDLREIITAGEQLQMTASIVSWLEKLGCPLHNQYGPSEAHVVTCNTLTGAPREWPVLPAVGKPIANVQIYVLDPYMHPVPIGVSGEVYVGGDCLARGYFNRPELTERVFLADPFAKRPGAKLYKTGDLARWLPDGSLEFLGRTDDQVKIRGFRVELGEITAVLSKHPELKEVAVIAREDQPGNKRLVAYVVPLLPDRAPTIANLSEHILKTLPKHMVPSAFVVMDKLPLTHNGKLERKALPMPEQARAKVDLVKAPRTPVEAIIAGAWAEVLGCEQISIEDNFFELGGHSLLATRVVTRLKQAWQIDLPVRALFQSPTVAQLAQQIESITRGEGEQLPPLTKLARQGDIPLSFAQQRLWFFDQLSEERALYNVPTLWKINGSLQLEALRWSLNRIVERHEALRTSFQEKAGEPIQVISPPFEVPLLETDLTHLGAGATAEARLRAKHAAAIPFDLATGRLIRAHVYRTAAQETLLLLNLHHIVSDGWSIGVLWKELAALYESFLDAEPIDLPNLEIQYADFARWKRDWMRGDLLAKRLEFWRDQLKGPLPVLHLPTDHPRGEMQTYRGYTRGNLLSQSLHQQLNELAKRQGVTLYMLLLAAYMTLLFRLTGQSDQLVGSPIANRNRAETEELIGFFVNTIVLRVNLADNPQFSEVVKKVRDTALAAYAHQDVPFDKLVELHPDRDPRFSPLFQTMFVLQNNRTPAGKLADLTVEAQTLDNDVAKFELTLYMEEKADGLLAEFEYNSDLFADRTIARLQQHWQALLAGIAEAPDRRISALPIVSAEDGAVDEAELEELF